MTYGALERRPTPAMAAGWWVCQERAHSSSFSLTKSGGGLSLSRANIRRRTGRLSGPESSSTRLMASTTMRSRPGWTRLGRSCPSGGRGSSKNDCQGWRNGHGGDAQPSFPPSVVVAVKALACELPHDLGLPLSRFTIPELKREVVRQGLVASIGETTLWRWLTEDAIRPWRHRTWIFPRDPDFEAKAGRVLDLYAGIWDGHSLRSNEFVVSADEKTSIQARRRCHPTLAPQPASPMRVEHEYERRGAWAYLAAWDVHRARIFGRCEPTTGIQPFDRLVAQLMTKEPYSSAHRVFWVVDNGSSHRGRAATQRLRSQWPNLVLVHTPVHASWLNQVEIYFSVVQRKVLTPNDFPDLADLEGHLHAFETHYQTIARPFQWKFTRSSLKALLGKLQTNPLPKAA